MNTLHRIEPACAPHRVTLCCGATPFEMPASSHDGPPTMVVALWTYRWRDVTCAACLAHKPANPSPGVLGRYRVHWMAGDACSYACQQVGLMHSEPWSPDIIDVSCKRCLRAWNKANGKTGKLESKQ